MEHRSGPILAVAAWLTWLLQMIAAHYNVALSVSCGLAALMASVYSMKASRAKEKFYQRPTSEPSQDPE